VEIHEVKVSHDGSKVFLVNIDVTQWLMADIYIVDTATNTVIDIIEVETKGIGPRPMLAVDPDDNKIYLTSGQNEGMYVDPDRGVNRLFIIDIPSRSVVNEIKITGGPVGIRLSSDGKFAYISTFIGKVVTVDLNQAAIVSEFPWNVYPANLKVGDLRDLVISPDGNRIYITAWDGDAIAIAEPAVGRITQVIDLNKIRTRPFEITISPDGRAYVSNYAFAEGSCPSIKVIDTSSHSIVGEISLEFNSRGLAVTPDGKFRDG
jgi:DNA-binding beta-propeller fold protein YncE